MNTTTPSAPGGALERVDPIQALTEDPWVKQINPTQYKLIKETVAKAAAQVTEVLPDPAEVKEQFLQASQKLMEILPDGDDLRALLTRTVEAVKTDPTIRQQIEAAADIVAQRLESTVGQGIDAVTEKAKAGAEKIGLEPLEHVAERIGEIAKEGVEELIDQTKEKALG